MTNKTDFMVVLLYKQCVYLQMHMKDAYFHPKRKTTCISLIEYEHTQITVMTEQIAYAIFVCVLRGTALF